MYIILRPSFVLNPNKKSTGKKEKVQAFDSELNHYFVIN